MIGNEEVKGIATIEVSQLNTYRATRKGNLVILSKAKNHSSIEKGEKKGFFASLRMTINMPDFEVLV